MLFSPRLLGFDANQLLLRCGQWWFKPVQATYLSYDYSCPDVLRTVFGVRVGLRVVFKNTLNLTLPLP